VSQNPFEGVARELRRAIEEHGRLFSEEMKRIQEQIQPAMESLKGEMERARAEFRRAIQNRQGQTADRSDRFDTRFKPVASRGANSPPKKRPPRKPPGSATAPVKPRPKPTPLMDGAEAPVE
jgi:hypothetical protein